MLCPGGPLLEEGRGFHPVVDGVAIARGERRPHRCLALSHVPLSHWHSGGLPCCLGLCSDHMGCPAPQGRLGFVKELLAAWLHPQGPC
jgi:hypothetical protein